MKIRSIEILRVGLPFGTDGPRQGMRPGMKSEAWTIKEALILRVTDDDGVEAWGEAFGHFCNPGTLALLKDLVGPWFIGRDASDPAGLVAEAQRAFHGFGRQGPCMYALSGMDIALWDLAAQHAGTPLYAMLGGPDRDVEITRYASLMSYGGDHEAIARNTERAVALGFPMVKLHERAMGPFMAAREAAPEGIGITLDVNCPWTVAEACGIARGLKQNEGVNGGFLWLEEPVWPPEDFSGLVEVRREGTAISGGENVGTVTEFRRAIAAGAFDVVQPSIAKVGGVSAVREIFPMAREAGLRCVPHAFYWGPAYVATAHLIAAQPEAAAGRPVWLETAFIDYADIPHDLIDPFNPKLLLRADRPGLGFRPDRDVLERHLISRTQVEA